MEFDVETLGGAIIWLVMMTLAGFAFYRAKTRRKHIGSGAAGSVYDMMNEDKRKAIEIVVHQLVDDVEMPGAESGGRLTRGKSSLEFDPVEWR